jgi:hypothetical protein
MYIGFRVRRAMPRIPVPASTQPRDTQRFLREFESRLEKLDRAILVGDWNQGIGRSSEGSAPWQLKRSALLSDERILAWVRAARRRGGPQAIERRLELLERILLDVQVEQTPEVVRLRAKMQSRIHEFRPVWRGRRVNRAVIMRVVYESPNEPERRRAYYALEPLYRPLEEGLRELVELRNQQARALGFRTMAEMRLSFDHLTPGRLKELGELTAGPARACVRALRDRFRDGTGQSGWHPWDLIYAQHRSAWIPDRLFPRREMLPRIFAALKEWGFRTDRMHFRVVFHDTPFGGLTLAPDAPRDIRILIHPMGGLHSYGIMFHEVGHAVHSSLIRAPRHLLRWHENIPGFGAFHEGVGGLFEDIPTWESWLSAQPGVGAKRAKEYARVTRDATPALAAWHTMFSRIEQTLYEHPVRDPMPEVHRFERDVFGYDDFEPLSFVDAFFVESPVYVQNYLLALLFGEQVFLSLRHLYGEELWPNRHVGPWLTRNWFAPGSLHDWLPRVKEVTGRPFGAEAFRSAFTAN